MNAGATSAQRIVVVVGAGRSGTSTLTRAVGALGVELGDRLKPASRKNPKGFFEDLDILALNQRVTRLFGLETTGTDVRHVDETLFTHEDVQALHDEAVALLRQRFGAFPLWGFKSGGILRLQPFWSQVFASLGAEPCYVVALRHPANVARSRARLNPLRGRPEKSDLEWLARMVPFFHLLRSRPLVVVDYDRLLGAPVEQLERIAVALELPEPATREAEIRQFTDEFLNADLRHHPARSADDLDGVDPLTARAYRCLYRLATDSQVPQAQEFWREWYEIQSALRAMDGALRHIDFLEGKLRRTRWGLDDALRVAGRRLLPVTEEEYARPG